MHKWHVWVLGIIKSKTEQSILMTLEAFSNCTEEFASITPRLCYSKLPMIEAQAPRGNETHDLS